MNTKNFKKLEKTIIQMFEELESCPDPKTELQERHLKMMWDLMNETGTLTPCSDCKKDNYKHTLVIRNSCGCDKLLCENCFECHDDMCDEFVKNLEQLKLEELKRYETEEVTKTRTSKKKALEQGKVQCCCHRWFVPEKKKEPDVYYKSCFTCRQKRKKAP